MLLSFSNIIGGEKLEVKIEKIIRFSILILLSMTYIWFAAYNIGYENGELFIKDHSILKKPMEYGIYKSFICEERLVEPKKWYTSEELGIVLIKNDHFDYYSVYIKAESKDKALSWMSNYLTESYIVKYDNKFLEIMFRWVEPGLNLRSSWIIPIGIALLIWWSIEIVFFLGKYCRKLKTRL